MVSNFRLTDDTEGVMVVGRRELRVGTRIRTARTNSSRFKRCGQCADCRHSNQVNGHANVADMSLIVGTFRGTAFANTARVMVAACLAAAILKNGPDKSPRCDQEGRLFVWNKVIGVLQEE